MTESYNVDGVTVKSTGGGWYELAHPSLSEPEKLQGKENADRRAGEIAKAAQSSTGASEEDDGKMQPQGPLTAPTGKPGEASQAAEDSRDAEMERLKAQLAETKQERDKLRAAADRTVTTVEALEGPKSEAAIPAGVPRAFKAELDEENAKLLKKLGVKTTKIVLEESETIPPTGLFVGHNGRSYVIVPGVEVTVPNFLLGVLDDAVMSSPQVDSKSQKVVGYRNRSRYPYRVVKD